MSTRIHFAGFEHGPLAVLVIGGGPILVWMSARASWWVGAAVFTGLAAAMTVRWNDRSGARWLRDWIGYRLRRSSPALARVGPAAIHDIQVAAGVCGIRTAGTTLVAMVQLAPNLDLPTVIAETSVYTEDTVAVDTLIPMLDQFGIGIDVDIVTTGQRMRPAGSYSMLYDQLVGAHPVVGNRLTWLVIRLDQEQNLAALTRRGRCEVVGPKALATAAYRIANRLRERGIAAQVLPAAAMNEAMLILRAGVDPSDMREQWGRLEASVPGRCVTSFLVDWTRLGDSGLDDCWTWNRGHTTLVLALTGSPHGPRALVRFVGPPAAPALPDYLRTLCGRQAVALEASLPSAISLRTLPTLPSKGDIAPAELVEGLAIPIGPSGQILGAISGQPQRTLALALFDPARYQPRRRTIDVRTALSVAQQIILRAMAVGADIEVYSSRPQHWRQLVAAVGDPRSLRLAADAGSAAEDPDMGASPATIAVFDQVQPRNSAAPTIVTIGEPVAGSPRRVADLQIRQVSATTVDVTIPMRTVRVELIEPRGETRYVGEAGDPAASFSGTGPGGDLLAR